MRRFMISLFLPLILSACANSSTVPGGGTGSPSPTIDQTRLGIYEAVVRHLAGSEEATWEKLYLRASICANADDAADPKDCDDAFAPDEQASFVAGLADVAPVEFVDSYADLGNRILTGKERSVYVWVGPIDEGSGTIEVPGSMTCGGLCGTGSTWVVEPDGDAWKVTGPAPGAGVWIS